MPPDPPAEMRPASGPSPRSPQGSLVPLASKGLVRGVPRWEETTPPVRRARPSSCGSPERHSGAFGVGEDARVWFAAAEDTPDRASRGY